MMKHVYYTVIFILELLAFSYTRKSGFGPYKLSIANITKCRSAKRESNNAFLNLIIHAFPNGTEYIASNVTVAVPIGPIGIRIKMYMIENATRNTIVNYNMKNACDHFLIGAIIYRIPDVSEDCFLSKGSSLYPIGEANTVAHTFFGSKFFYGSYFAHIFLFTPREQLLCINLQYEVSPIEM